MQIIAKRLAIAGVFLILTLSGCDELSQTAKKTVTTQTSKASRVPVHRFVLTRHDADVAFDTQTGQLCRTWDWRLSGKPSKPDAESGTMPQRSIGEFTPTCLTLYREYPSGVNPDSEALLDEQPSN